MNRQRLLVTLPLQPLGAAESRALAANLLHGEVAPGTAELLHRHGEGNPFFLEELLRTLVEQRSLAWHGEQWELGALPERLLPPGAAEAIRARLARLDPEMADLLRVAAVAGRSWEPALLARMAQLDIERVDGLLMVAARAQLVRPDADGTSDDPLPESIDRAAWGMWTAGASCGARVRRPTSAAFYPQLYPHSDGSQR